MAHYIDADRLRAEIERLYYNEAEKDESILSADAYKNALDAVEKFLDSLQQEQPEVDLEKEVKRWKNKQGIVGMDDLWLKFARHFYELGLNARKEDK